MIDMVNFNINIDFYGIFYILIKNNFIFLKYEEIKINYFVVISNIYFI